MTSLQAKRDWLEKLEASYDSDKVFLNQVAIAQGVQPSSLARRVRRWKEDKALILATTANTAPVQSKIQVKTQPLPKLDNRPGQDELDYTVLRSHYQKLASCRDVVKVAVLNDIHFPFHAERVLYGPVLEVLKDFKPDFISDGSDIFDCPLISNFTNTEAPDLEETLDGTLKLYQDWRQALRDILPAHKSFFVMGNHDRRFWQWLQEHGPYFAAATLRMIEVEIRSTGTLFFGWKYFMIDFGGLLGVHHNLYATKYPARKFMDKHQSKYSAIIGGHTHRSDIAHRNDVFQGVPYQQVATITGCLCDLTPHYSKKREPELWDNSFALATINTDAKVASVDIVRIEPSTATALWNGRVYK